MKKFTVTLEEDPDTGELILPLPDGFCDEMGWEIGDTLKWKSNKDGSFVLSKKKKVDTQLVLVECISTFRNRYVVEVPIGTDNYGKDKSEWALDTVVMNEAKEFSQEYLGEQIVSHRVITSEEALELCDKDNDYVKSWTTDKKFETFVTSWDKDGNEN